MFDRLRREKYLLPPSSPCHRQLGGVPRRITYRSAKFLSLELPPSSFYLIVCQAKSLFLSLEQLRKSAQKIWPRRIPWQVRCVNFVSLCRLPNPAKSGAQAITSSTGPEEQPPIPQKMDLASSACVYRHKWTPKPKSKY